ncbi:hypothetical protein GN244_ATG10424 [Phytophthora infestans]|uniref:Uncharacterized protein n=1 Tax=Phytophthora infestans TaxID=4787 RepID=A0A833WUF0_PHYIN|nr:hypothetical protein GN244_ATG10424 [Phytophthora infestans]
MACEINVRGEVIRRGRGGATTTVEIQEAPNGLAQRCPVAGGAVKCDQKAEEHLVGCLTVATAVQSSIQGAHSMLVIHWPSCRLSNITAWTAVTKALSFSVAGTTSCGGVNSPPIWRHSFQLHPARVVAELSGHRERLTCPLQLRIVDTCGRLLEDVRHVS